MLNSRELNRSKVMNNLLHICCKVMQKRLNIPQFHIIIPLF